MRAYAYNYAKLRGLTPHEFIWAQWQRNLTVFTRGSAQLTLGLYIQAVRLVKAPRYCPYDNRSDRLERSDRNVQVLNLQLLTAYTNQEIAWGAGKYTVKVEPSPRVLCTSIRPPVFSSMRFTM